MPNVFRESGGIRYGSLAFTVDDPRIEPCPSTGCWIWTKALMSGGYGFGYDVLVGRDRVAHKATWERVNGPVPAGLVLDHLCRLRSCVNPDHLRAVTVRQNNTINSLSFAAVNSAKPVCPKCGSAYSRTSNGKQRKCDVCRKKLAAAYTNFRRSIREGAVDAPLKVREGSRTHRTLIALLSGKALTSDTDGVRQDVFTLRSKGYRIQSRFVTVGADKRVSEYSLLDK